MTMGHTFGRIALMVLKAAVDHHSKPKPMLKTGARTTPVRATYPNLISSAPKAPTTPGLK